jgi:transposase-like protein
LSQLSTRKQNAELRNSGLGNFSLRELLGALLSNLAQAERGAYLQNQLDDKANGFYPRSLLLGSVPVEMEVLRTRSGQFRPPSLPARNQRGYSEETQSLLLGLLSSSRSVSAARQALHKMGLSNSQQELEAIAAGSIEERDLRNTRPLDPDLLALFFDGKYVEVRDGDRLKPAGIYLVVGLGRDGKKRVLACLSKSGRENLEDWKLVLRSLLERGLRRVLIVIFRVCCPLSKACFPLPMFSYA